MRMEVMVYKVFGVWDGGIEGLEPMKTEDRSIDLKAEVEVKGSPAEDEIEIEGGIR